MRVRAVLGILAVLVAAAVCIRLGFWQLSRLDEKRALNRALDRARSSPPVPAGAEPPAPEAVEGRYARFEGRYDHARQVVLAGRARAGVPGVRVVTPLLLAGGAAVLVDRGWLPAADAATARPEDYPEPGWVRVVGVVEPLERGRGDPPLRIAEREGVTLLTGRRLDLDTLARRLPYRLAPYMVRQTPGPGVPATPTRAQPRRHDEAIHLGYAVQWFSFAAIALVGTGALAWKRRRPPSWPPGS
jgi:surfeit locus 1 family protein